MSTFAISITIAAISLFGAFILLGAWIDGRRQALRDKGLHPVTDAQGKVTTRESIDALSQGSKEHSHGTGHDTPPREIH